MTGLIHIYEGNGKGKTSAAIGLTIRAIGAGKKVVFVQFLKDDTSSEISILQQIDTIQTMLCKKKFGFVFQMNEDEKEEAKLAYRKLFFEAFEMANASYDVLILDEVLGMLEVGFLSEAEVREQLSKKRDDLEVVLTGQNPECLLEDMADYVTRMGKIKHPYDQGIGSRIGIEY